MDEQQPIPAEFGVRCAALMIEALGFVMAVGSVFYVEGLVLAPLDLALPMPPWPWSNYAMLGLALVSLAWAYQWRRSPGMVALDLELIDIRTGRRPPLWACAVRAVCTVVGGLIVLASIATFFIAGAPHGPGLGFAWLWYAWGTAGIWAATYLPMRFTTRRQSLWDLVTRTAVVQRPAQRRASAVAGGPGRARSQGREYP
jgi:uncharacterized RDD family membrane protein YckC